MTGLVTFVDSSLYLAGLYSSIETTFFFYRKEQFPCLLGDGYSQVFNIVRTGSRINHLVEVRFFLQQQLLVAGHTLGEVIGSCISLIERNNRH